MTAKALGPGGPGVLMLTPGFHPHLGGAEKQALELSKALAKRGIPVRVLTRRLNGLAAYEEIAGIAVHRTAAWGGGLLNAAVFLLSSLAFLLSRARLYRVIHVHLAGSPALAACLAARLLGKGVVVKVGGGRGIGEIALSAKTFPGRLKLLLLRWFKPRFAAVTRDLAAEMAEHGLSARVSVVPNGVDIERYRPVDPARRDALRERLGWPRGLAFLFVGRFAPEKRLDSFLRVFAEVVLGGGAKGAEPARARASAFCVLVGAGPEERLVRAEAELLGLKERVRFLAPTEEIAPLYAAADVFVLPSASEGLSNALLEAMASGLAIFASRVGGTKEAVADGRSGLLFDPEDARDPGAQLEKFFLHPELCGGLGRAAREDAARFYALDVVAERYVELYGLEGGV